MRRLFTRHDVDIRPGSAARGAPHCGPRRRIPAAGLADLRQQRSPEGARDDGCGGFAKGVGTGLIGVVARPLGGLVDFTSSTINAVKT